MASIMPRILDAYESSGTSLGEFAVLLKKTLAYPEQIAKDYIETIFNETVLGNEVPNEKQRFFHGVFPGRLMVKCHDATRANRGKLESVAQDDTAFFIVKYTVASIFRRIMSVPKTYSAKRLTLNVLREKADFEKNDDSLGDFAILLHQTQFAVDHATADHIHDCAIQYCHSYLTCPYFPPDTTDKQRLFHGAFSCAVKSHMEDIFQATLDTMKRHVNEDRAFVKAFDRISCLLGDTIVRRIVSSADVRALVTLKPSTDITETCPICCDEDTGALVLTPCGHLFHPACILTWVQTKKKDARCPMCRGALVS
ncbi:hypothetical protein TSOC_007122 [Tetrabaena socialis]|uniref:Anaphase-promoting complex subunit 11 n=1 Tax=Tetrabaena socialis TaxID=47790 RepID=A0A2J8A1S1_9CHLO|nr:hypothetical protein TSOC_007122 [Tetrabaena socialis]|eukprot:PNH06462.1 hypothetical protein TSOC_007122 [Tetrabaena socialis]